MTRFWLALPQPLTSDECAAVIRQADAHGLAAAEVRMASGPKRRPDIRTNDRAIVTDLALQALLWARLRPHQPVLEQATLAVLGGMFGCTAAASARGLPRPSMAIATRVKACAPA